MKPSTRGSVLKYLTINGLAVYLKISKPTVYKWMAENKIPYIRINKRVIRFDKEKVDMWVEKYASKTA
jgi:excisionase family DNA binding protein